MNEIYESFSGYLTEDSKKFLVAFSGGLDSTVLLYALKQALVKEKLNKEILAIHVDHKQNKNSKDWIEHCKKFCEKTLDAPPGTQKGSKSPPKVPNWANGTVCLITFHPLIGFFRNFANMWRHLL